MYLLTIKSIFVKQAQLLEEERKGKCILQGLSVNGDRILLQTGNGCQNHDHVTSSGRQRR